MGLERQGKQGCYHYQQGPCSQKGFRVTFKTSQLPRSTSMGKKPKIVEIDIIRAIAILAVVVIHGTSNAVMLPLGTVSQAVFFAVNRLSHFTVPVFIWVSGLVLFYSYYDA